MPYCIKCGYKVNEDSPICPQCGTSIYKPKDINNSAYASPQITEQDFITFIGKNADIYINKFKKFNIGGIDSFAATWHWPAFFTGPIWMLYRKLYIHALIFLVISFLPYFGLITWIAAGIMANYLYYKHAKAKISEIRSSITNPYLDIHETLARMGGVNSWVYTACVVIIAVIIVVLFLAIIGLLSIQLSPIK